MKRTILALVALLICATISTAAPKDNTKTEKTLTVIFNVQDYFNHNGIDSLKVKANLAGDTTHVMTFADAYTYGGKKVTHAGVLVRKPGKYLVSLTAEGYKPREVEIDIPKLYKHENSRELKAVSMHPLPKLQQEKVTEMNEVEVKATKLKFYMDGDTLTYNADAFNLAEGSMLNNLIRRLPGVELKAGGEILVNGKRVEAMLLNGKDFFNKDRELLLENMPAYMVKSVQAYERVPEQYIGTPKEKNARKEQVLNVKLKREYSTGWIANADAGVAPYLFRNDKEHFTRTSRDLGFLARMFGMKFSDNYTFFGYANANSLNDYREPGEKGEWTPLQQSTGLSTSYRAGVGGTYSKTRAFKYNGKLNASYTDSRSEENTNSATFLEGGNTYGRSGSDRTSYDWNINTNHEITLHPEYAGKLLKNRYLTIEPSFDWRRWDNLSNSASVTLDEDVAERWGKAWLDSLMAPAAGELLRRYAINRTLSTTKRKGHHIETRGDSYGSAYLAHNDRVNFYLNANYYYKNRVEDGFEHYRLDYPKGTAPNDYRNRYNPVLNRDFNVNMRARMGYALDKMHRHSLHIDEGISYSNSLSTYSIYLLNKLDSWAPGGQHGLGMLPSTEALLSTFDGPNSTRTHRYTIRNTPSMNYSYSHYDPDKSVSTLVHATLTVELNNEQMDYTRYSQLDTVMSRRTVFLVPQVYFSRSNYTKQQEFSIQYYVYASAPSMTNLLNITDNENPLYVWRGNDNLKNEFMHNASTHYRDKWKSTLFNAGISWNLRQNAIASGYIYDRTTGVRTVRPENVNGNWGLNASSGIDFRLTKDDKLRMKENLSWDYNHSVDLSGTGQMTQPVRSIVGTHYTHSQTELTYRPTDKLEFGAKANAHWQLSNSERTDFQRISAVDFDYGLLGQVELPWNMQLATDITMYSRRGYSEASMNTNELVWNARLTKRLMKGNLLVQLDGFDLLGNLSNVRRYVNAQGRTETFYNVIPSYALLHLTWRLNKEPKKK